MAHTNPIKTEAQFKYSPELVEKYGTYQDYWAAQMKELRTTSAWTFSKNTFFEMRNKQLERHNAESEKLINRYKQFEKVYNEMKKQQSAIETQLCSEYRVSNAKDLSLAMKENPSLTNQSKFNLAARNTNEARINYEVALSIANDQTHRIV